MSPSLVAPAWPTLRLCKTAPKSLKTILTLKLWLSVHQPVLPNLLVGIAHTVMSKQQIKQKLTEIDNIQQAILNALDNTDEICQKLQQLQSSLSDLALHEEMQHRADLKDALLSHGERMSSLLFSAVLNQFDVKAENFDVRNVLKTDSEFGQAVPNLEQIAIAAKQLMLPTLSGTVLVTQGFVGADSQGKTTTLGRGGSDFTAALLAEGLGAKTCENLD